mmetsp:Transcript_3349/g.12896  ORF Transcript_3349/g.12896 Transcript_3349/m.12896 type:complete len:211 (-) Transcript_3349:321-953(-)
MMTTAKTSRSTVSARARSERSTGRPARSYAQGQIVVRVAALARPAVVGRDAGEDADVVLDRPVGRAVRPRERRRVARAGREVLEGEVRREARDRVAQHGHEEPARLRRGRRARDRRGQQVVLVREEPHALVLRAPRRVVNRPVERDAAQRLAVRVRRVRIDEQTVRRALAGVGPRDDRRLEEQIAHRAERGVPARLEVARTAALDDFRAA